MDLLKYLTPMKNMPERFSNLAFWRGVRNLKDMVVNAFEYVNSWGTNIESELANNGMKIIKTVNLTSNMLTIHPNNNSYFATVEWRGISGIPSNAKLAIINIIFSMQVGNKAYSFSMRSATPVSDGNIVYKSDIAISSTQVTLDAQPTFTFATSHIWYFG